MKRIALLLIVSLLLVCFLPACGGNEKDNRPPHETPPTPDNESTGSQETQDSSVSGSHSTEPGIEVTGSDTNDTSEIKSPEGDDSVKHEPYKHVIVIGVDGAGAFFKDAKTPYIDAIFQNGAVTYDMLTANPTISAVLGLASARCYPCFPQIDQQHRGKQGLRS